MDAVPDGSVSLVVTSPPYPMIELWDEQFAAADPPVARALAAEDGNRAFDAMHTRLDAVWRECRRVLQPGGLACINIGDATRNIGGEFRLFSNHSRILQALTALGFSVLPDILWRKPTNAPNKFLGSGMLPAGAYVTYEHEYILIARNGGPRKFSPADKARRRRSAFFWEERNQWFSDVWLDLVGARQLLGNAGFDDRDTRTRSAAYPFELAYRLIQMYSLSANGARPVSDPGRPPLAAIAGAAPASIEIERARGTHPQHHRDRRPARCRIRSATSGCTSGLRAVPRGGGPPLPALERALRLPRRDRPGDRSAVRRSHRGCSRDGRHVLCRARTRAARGSLVSDRVTLREHQR